MNFISNTIEGIRRLESLGKNVEEIKDKLRDSVKRDKDRYDLSGIVDKIKIC